MMGRIKKALFAVALMPVNAPLEERLKILSQFVEPKPGTVLELNERDLRDQSSQLKTPEKIFGTIRISPPKGSCFVVTTDLGRPDQEVCKPSHLRWYLGDLDRERGTIRWTIKTSPSDFGTQITWHTPYTVAKTLPPESSFYSLNSRPVFFKRCTASRPFTPGSLRQLVFTKFDGGKWIFRFPDVDEPIPKKEVVEVVEEPKKDKKSEHKEPPKEEAEKAEKKEEESAHQKKEEASKSEEKKPEEEEEEPWNFNTGRGYEMSVDNFITQGSMPPGKKGRCRYVYDYIPGDHSLGRIECHHTDEYKYAHIFPRCFLGIINSPRDHH